MFKDKGILKALWAGMFIVCGVLGFISQPGSGAKVLMIVLAVLFFVPPFADVYFSIKRKDTAELRLVRNLCLISLGATMAVLIANVLSVLSESAVLGDVLYYALVIVSTPMICGQYWAYSLLLWAILLWSCIAALKKHK